MSLALLDFGQKLYLIPYNSLEPSTEYGIVVSSPQTLVKLILGKNPQCLCCHPPIKFYMLSKSEQFYKCTKALI